MKTCKHCTEPALSYSSRSLCRIHHNEYYREYRKNNLEKVRAIHRVSRVKVWKKNERERIRTNANNAVKYAKMIGKIKPKLCKCGKEAQAHHSSYRKEDWLKVTWLCVDHHSEWHRNNEPTY